jgi:hypothetical protein
LKVGNDEHGCSCRREFLVVAHVAIWKEYNVTFRPGAKRTLTSEISSNSSTWLLCEATAVDEPDITLGHSPTPGLYGEKTADTV